MDKKTIGAWLLCLSFGLFSSFTVTASELSVEDVVVENAQRSFEVKRTTFNSPTKVATKPKVTSAQKQIKQGKSDNRSLFFMPLSSTVISKKQLALANASVEGILRQEFGPGLVTEKEMANMIQFGDEAQSFDCVESQACLMELTQNLNADLVFGGTIGKVGSRYIVTAYIVDGKRGSTAARVAEEAVNMEAIIATSKAAALKAVRNLSSTGKALTVNLDNMQKNTKIAVMDFVATGVDEFLARNITAVVAAELKQFSGLQIISRQEVSTLLSFEGTKQSVGCSDESCFVEIGNALGAHYLLSGSVGLLNDVYLISVKVINIRKVKVVGRDHEYFKGPSDGLLPASRFVVRRVLGAPLKGEGLVKFTMNAHEAQVSWDGNDVGIYPKLTLPKVLSVGKHQVSVEHKDYFPLLQDVYVEPAQQAQVDLAMLKRPTPWYKTWWFWTVVGAVVVGGATTGAVLGTMDGGSPDTGSGKILVEGN